MIKIYTDGSSTKNRAGWGFVVVLDDEIIYEQAGTEHKGDTNQLMELTAAIEACDWVLQQSAELQQHNVTIYSDSAYLVNCYQDKWYINWENNRFFKTISYSMEVWNYFWFRYLFFS